MSSQTSMLARAHLPDLLTRPPSGTREFVNRWDHALVDVVAELELLGGLLATGLISRVEFERYKAQIDAVSR